MAVKDMERPYMQDVDKMTDRALLNKLVKVGIHLDKPTLEALGRDIKSVEEISTPLTEKYVPEEMQDSIEAEWVFTAVWELWMRWFPDSSVFECVSAKMNIFDDFRCQQGMGKTACRYFLKIWPSVLRFLCRCEFETEADFRRRYPQFDEILAWLELSLEFLVSLGRDDDFIARAAIEVCEEYIETFAPDEQRGETIDCIRRLLTQAYFEIGGSERATGLLTDWLEIHPQWAEGWITLARSQEAKTLAELEYAEAILKRGLSFVKDPEGSDKESRDRERFNNQLAELCERQGRAEEAQEYKLELNVEQKRLQREAFAKLTDSPFGELVKLMLKTPPSRGPKITANQLCPCRSGLKFKRCCGQDR